MKMKLWKKFAIGFGVAALLFVAIASVGYATGVRLRSECPSGSASGTVCFDVLDQNKVVMGQFVSGQGFYLFVPFFPAGPWSFDAAPNSAFVAPASGHCAMEFVLVSSVPHVQVQCNPGSLGPLQTLDTGPTGFLWNGLLNITISGGAVSGTTASQFQPQRALTITGIQFSPVSANLSCTVYPQLQVYDTTAGAPLNSGFVIGPSFSDDGPQNIAVTSGHLIGLRIDPTHLGSGCSNATFNTEINVIYN